MAVGSTNSLTGYTIGGKPLGVQLGSKSATSLFGDGTASAASVFSANLASSSASGVDSQQLILNGLQNQIDRIQGFRTNLTPAEKEQLTKYQTTITDINQTATTRLLTKIEIRDRADAYIQAYKILGKEYEDFSNDAFIQEKSTALTELLATKPKGAEAEHLERLENVLATLKDAATNRDTDPPATLIARITSVNRQVAQLTAARPISTLSKDELRQHDELVEAINIHAGFDVELTSRQKLQIEHLQKTMDLVQQGAFYA